MAPVPRFHRYYEVLQRPTVPPAALRCLRLAVPRLHSCFVPVAVECAGAGLELISRYPTGHYRGGRRTSQVPGEPLRPYALFFDPGRTAHTRPLRCVGMAPRYVHGEGSHEIPAFEAQSHGFGRVAAGLTPCRSHRSGRAQLRHPVRQRAGWQRRRHGPTTPLDAIQRGDGDKERSRKVLPLVPPAGSARRQRPSLPWVRRGAFPSFHGTMALCDSLRPSRRAPLPSLGDTLRCACRFAPGGPGRPTAGLGFVVRSPQPESSRREAVRASQVPVQPAVPMPCSSTPAGPHAPGHYGAATRPPLCPRRRLPRFIQLSRLNRTALGLAVYASPGALPHKTQNSLPAAGQALPGGDQYPAGQRRERFIWPENA